MNEKENFAPEFNALSREGQGAFVGSAFTPSELGAYLRHFNTKLYCQIWRTFARQLQDQIPLYHMPLARGPGIHIRTCLLFCFDLKKQFFSISFFYVSHDTPEEAKIYNSAYVWFKSFLLL